MESSSLDFLSSFGSAVVVGTEGVEVVPSRITPPVAAGVSAGDSGEFKAKIYCSVTSSNDGVSSPGTVLLGAEDSPTWLDLWRSWEMWACEGMMGTNVAGSLA